MTVESIYVPVSNRGNGVTVAFFFPYQFFAPSDLIVRLFDLSTNTAVAPAPLLNGAAAFDYTVTGTIDDEGTGEYLNGTVTFNAAPPGNYQITILRSVAPLQSVSLADDSLFPAKSVEAELDRLQMQIQQGTAVLARAIVAPASDDPPPNLVLDPAAKRADTVLSFDGAGNIARPGLSAGAIALAIAGIAAGLAPVPLTGAWAPNLAAAKVLYAAPVAVPDRQVVAVSCRASAGDGYFDQFIYDGGDATTVFALDGLGYVDAAGRRWKRQPHQYIREDWYVVGGIAGDGVTDETPALNAAVADATLAKHKVVHVGTGQHRLTGTITLHEGVPIIGVGGQGSDYTNGVVYMCEPAANNTIMFLWDGNGAFVGGTGGGLQNALIMKNNATTGCTAIKVIATDDNHRPGEMIFRNILSYGVGNFRFEEGFVVDGTAANTPGAKGVRSILAEKVRMASCATNCFRLTQAVHFFSTYLEMDLGTAAVANFLIEGDWDDIFLNGLELNGTLTVGGVVSPQNEGNITATGRIATLNVIASYARGAMAIQSTGITNASKNLKIVSNISDAVRAEINTPSFSQTGDGTSLVPSPFIVGMGNANNNWDNLNKIWVCKIAGKYAAHWSGSYTGMGASHTRHDTVIVHDNGSGGILASLSNGPSNPFACAAVGGNAFGATADCVFDCAAGERLYPKINVSGGTKTVGLFGGPIDSGGTCFFSVVPVQG